MFWEKLTNLFNKKDKYFIRLFILKIFPPSLLAKTLMMKIRESTGEEISRANLIWAPLKFFSGAKKKQ